MLTSSGEFVGRYAKTHPMVTSGDPWTQSVGFPVVDTPFGQLASIICYDGGFTDVARKMSRQGANLLASPSLFGRPLTGMTHAQVVFRAIENLVAIIMADVAHTSAIVDSYGRIMELSVTPAGEQLVLVQDVRLGSGRSLYARTGDYPGWRSLAVLCWFAVFMPGTVRRARERDCTRTGLM